MSHDSRAAPLAGVNIAALTLATTVTALRCFVRIRLLKAFGSDDWLMVAAAISFIFYCTFSLTGIVHGTGHHVADLTPEANSTARKWWWLCYPTYAVTMTLTKMSIAFFFRRVIVERVHKWILAAATVVTLISCGIFFFACIFQCWPVSYFWDKTSQTGTCIPDSIVIALGMLFSAVNVVTDLAFALMPAWILSHLNMRLKTKVALCVLMGLGCVASAAVVIRMPYMHFIASDDFLYDTVDVAIWSTIEQALAITAGGLATLQPLVKMIGLRLGLVTSPSPVDGGNNNNMSSGFRSNNIRLDEGGIISVRRSFTHRSEVFAPGHKPSRSMAVDLHPGAGQYSAQCYNMNTSQELLREPTAGSDGKGSGDSEGSIEQGMEGGKKMPAVYIRNRN